MKIHLLLLALFIIYIIYLCFYNNNENFANTSILSDIDAIKNLAAISKDLQTVNGLTLPGSLTVSGNSLTVSGNTLKIGSWTLSDNNGTLSFINDNKTAVTIDKTGIMATSGSISARGNIKAIHTNDTRNNVGHYTDGHLIADGNVNAENLYGGYLNVPNGYIANYDPLLTSTVKYADTIRISSKLGNLNACNSDGCGGEIAHFGGANNNNNDRIKLTITKV